MGDKAHRALWGMSLLAAIYAGSAYTVSRFFPPVSPDEVFVAVHGSNFLQGRGQRYSLYDDLFTPSVYAFRDAAIEVTRPVHDAWVGLFQLVIRSPASARASSWAAGVLVLWMFFLVGRHLGGAPLGITLAALTLANPLFWFGSGVVRPELLLLASSAFALWWILVVPPFRWKDVMVGVIGGLSLGIHPNAVAVFFGLFLVDMLLRPIDRRVPAALAWLLGAGAGAIVILGMINIPRFVLVRQTLQYQFAIPPLLSGVWNPVHWIKGTLHMFLDGQTYYADIAGAMGWHAALWCYAIGVVLAVLSPPAGRVRDAGGFAMRRSTWAFGALGTGAVFVVAVSREEALYQLCLQPFLVPLVGLSLAGAWSTKRRVPRVVAAGAVLCLVTSMACYAHFVGRSCASAVPPAQILERIQARVPSGVTRVAGPNLLWYGFPSEDFRDVGAAAISRYYTGGQVDLRETLSRWQPQILVVDAYFVHIVLRQTPVAQALSRILGKPVESLGAVDTGSAYGRWDLYRIQWS